MTGIRDKYAATWYGVISPRFARKAVSETVATQICFNGRPEQVWNHLLFYEEVPGPPPLLLRALLPHPVRTEGVKNRVGSSVRCVYRVGDLVKRITKVEPPHLLQFEVIEQRLGIESCILTFGGSYEIHTCGPAITVTVITNYQAYLRPRYLWRPLEVFFVHQLHRHILRAIRLAVPPTDPFMRPFVAKSLPSKYIPPGDLACTASQSRSRR
jgi:hypothetical protein